MTAGSAALKEESAAPIRIRQIHRCTITGNMDALLIKRRTGVASIFYRDKRDKWDKWDKWDFEHKLLRFQNGKFGKNGKYRKSEAGWGLLVVCEFCVFCVAREGWVLLPADIGRPCRRASASTGWLRRSMCMMSSWLRWSNCLQRFAAMARRRAIARIHCSSRCL